MKGFLNLGNGVTAFIDGPDTCKHKWNGPSIMYTSKGKRVDISTHLKWAGYTDQFRRTLIFEHYNMIDDPIVECGSSCSKCGSEFSPFSLEL